MVRRVLVLLLLLGPVPVAAPSAVARAMPVTARAPRLTVDLATRRRVFTPGQPIRVAVSGSTDVAATLGVWRTVVHAPCGAQAPPTATAFPLPAGSFARAFRTAAPRRVGTFRVCAAYDGTSAVAERTLLVHHR